jgi:CRISPR-associated protein Cas2
MLYLVAYDIADPRRLQRVARQMTRHALRCQKSVFLYRGTREGLVAVLERVDQLLNQEEDVVQAWKLAAEERPEGLVRGTRLPCRPAGVVCEPGRQAFVIRESE